MLGKIITLHQDGVVNATLLYRPEVSNELTLSVSWLRDHVTIDLSISEMEALGKALTKGAKKVRKYRRKLLNDRFVSLDTVSDNILKGRRK